MVLTKRNILAFLVSLFFIVSGKVRRACKRAMKGDFILSIYFHNPSKKEFESIISWLIKRKFHFISLSDFEKIVAKSMPFPKGAVLVTVDDGWEPNEVNIAEVANRYQIPVGIFVSTEPVETGNAYWWSYGREALKRGISKQSINELKKVANVDRLTAINRIKDQVPLSREAMTIGQIQRISQSDFITIGGHTHSHPVLTNCTDDEVREELALSKEKLTLWTNKEVKFFAYPNGDFSDREIGILKELNYKMGFANNAQYVTRGNLDQNFRIPRFGFLEGASFLENICRVVGVWKMKRGSFLRKK